MTGTYHFVLCQVADALSDPRADEVGGVAQEDGAARHHFASIALVNWLKALLYLSVWSQQIPA